MPSRPLGRETRFCGSLHGAEWPTVPSSYFRDFDTGMEIVSKGVPVPYRPQFRDPGVDNAMLIR
jgi:hypothetical protein